MEPGRDDRAGREAMAREQEERIARGEARPPRGTPIGPGIGGAIPGEAVPPVGEEILEAHPGPGVVPIDEDELGDRMDAESPDGRPPDLQHRRQARALFLVLWIVPILVVSLLAYYAGWVPALLAVVFMTVFVGIAAWPTWQAALNRKMDTDRVKREVVQERTPPPEGREQHSGDQLPPRVA